MNERSSTFLLAAAAMTGFAANSLLCRAALLRAHSIDPISFTSIRLASGAIVLALIAGARSSDGGLAVAASRGSWKSAAALFLYAIAFSLAYVRLTTGTGALLLFAVVQITMIGSALRGGERMRAAQWSGFIVALTGVIILCLPGVTAPDPIGAALMTIAGIAWGTYSLRGRSSQRPLEETAGNFARALPFALLLSAGAFLLARLSTHVSVRGSLLALASGAVASGIGYTLWYAVVPRMTAMRASILQLSVPVLAAVGGIMALGEQVTPRLLLAGVVTLSGVTLALNGGARKRR